MIKEINCCCFYVNFHYITSQWVKDLFYSFPRINVNWNFANKYPSIFLFLSQINTYSGRNHMGVYYIYVMILDVCFLYGRNKQHFIL